MAGLGFSDSDDDSDFPWPFSPADDIDLIQLADASAASPSRCASAVASPPHGATLTSSSHHEFCRCSTSPQATLLAYRRPTRGVSQRKTPNYRSYPASASALHTDVVYPDCAHSLALPRWGSRPANRRFKRLVSRALSELDDTASPPAVDAAATAAANVPQTPADGASPLERFRSFPRKPLSVSDLTSGTWCELQYAYTLTRLPGGRRVRTQAMRGGSKVHQALEDQVHTKVEIDVVSKEDRFALKLWNVVQGLRTLRDTGLTRELEVWGFVDGNLVNGIIDGLSHENPNPGFEQELSSQKPAPDGQQSTLTDYFPPQRSHDDAPTQGPKVYLSDVKTRGRATRVSQPLLRPAKIQLLLYHRFLADMAAGRLDFLAVLSRYGLDPNAVLSDAFLAQMASMHEEEYFDAPSSPPATAASDSGDDTNGNATAASQQTTKGSGLPYRTLDELLPLVRNELTLAFPEGQDTLGHMLRVQYVLRDDGRELDVHDFPVSRQVLDVYLDDYMRWWRGERQARGVDIEEAFKCRSCDFVGDCEWRQSMNEARLQRAQGRVRKSSSSAAAGGA